MFRNATQAKILSTKELWEEKAIFYHINQTSRCDSDFFVGCSKSTGTNSSIDFVSPYLHYSLNGIWHF